MTTWGQKVKEHNEFIYLFLLWKIAEKIYLKVSLAAHVFFYCLYYAVGLISWCHKVEEHNKLKGPYYALFFTVLAHGGYYYLCYTVGLTSGGQKVKEHNEFIHLFYINCKKLLKLYIWKIGLVAQGGYYYLCYAVGLTTWGQKVKEHKKFIY